MTTDKNLTTYLESIKQRAEKCKAHEISGIDSREFYFQDIPRLVAMLESALISLELMASSPQFKEGDYGYQFILVAKETISRISALASEGV